MTTPAFLDRPAELRSTIEEVLGFYGRKYFVDAKLGNNSNRGELPSAPLLTMTAAFAKLKSGDTIVCRGKIKEQLTTPAGVFDVTIIGAANRPRHADDHTESDGARGSSSATWVSPDSATAATPLLKVQQQGWKVVNMLWGAGPANTATVQVFRDGGAGDAERDGSHFHIVGCRFSAPVIGVQASGGPAFIVVEDCVFHGATSKAIGETTGAGIGTNLLWQVKDCQFHDNANHIVAPLSQGTIIRNVFGKFTTKGVDLTSGAGYNQVNANFMSGDYDAGYVAASNDDWAGNYSMDVTSAEVGAEGLTIAVPVA